MSWVLILYIYAGALSNGDSVALTSIPGFATEQECLIAADKAEDLASGFKSARSVCVKQTK